MGMLHAPPLPGAPLYAGDFNRVLQHVLDDAAALVDGGVDALMLENFGDVPFFPGPVPAVTIASMTRLAVEIRHRYRGPLGLNVLRNDGLAALAIAQACEADFIRVNVLNGARVTDQGLIQGNAAELLRERAARNAAAIAVLADIDVKHSAPLAPRPLEEEIEETVARGGADAIIMTGHRTGGVPDEAQVRAAYACVPELPLLVGSGITAANIDRFLPICDAVLVGTACKQDGRVENAVDRQRVEQLAARVRQYRAASAP